MTAMFTRIPDRIVYCFAPSYHAPERPQQIRMVFAGASGFVPTSLGARNLAQAEALCDRLNAPLGISNEQRMRMLAHALASASADPGRVLH